MFKAKQNRNGERNIQTNVSVKYLLNSFTMSVRTIVITTCQFHRGIMTISRLRSVSPSLLSCSSHFFRALKQNKAQSGLLYLLSDKSKYGWTWHYRMEQMPIFQYLVLYRADETCAKRDTCKWRGLIFHAPPLAWVSFLAPSLRLSCAFLGAPEKHIRMAPVSRANVPMFAF